MTTLTRPAKSKPKPKKKRERTVAGVVVRARGHHFDVATAKDKLISCRVRGRLLQERTKDLTFVAVGDRVQVVLEGNRSGLIDSVEERESTLSRQLPGSTRPAEDVIVANPDQVLIVFAVQGPGAASADAGPLSGDCRGQRTAGRHRGQQGRPHRAGGRPRKVPSVRRVGLPAPVCERHRKVRSQPGSRFQGAVRIRWPWAAASTAYRQVDGRDRPERRGARASLSTPFILS